MSDTQSSGSGDSLAALTAAIDRLTAAIETSNQHAARALPVAEAMGAEALRMAEESRDVHPALRMPLPKGHLCAAGCGHHIGTHSEAGCNTWLADGPVCGCPAPYGRLMPPPETPNDLSTLDGAA